MKEILNDANKIIIDEEKKIIEDLENKAIREQERAEACGCPSCRAGSERAWDELSEEMYRQTTRGRDEEEERITKYALQRLEEKKINRDQKEKVAYIIKRTAEMLGWDGTGNPALFLCEVDPSWDRKIDWGNREFVDMMYKGMKDIEEDEKRYNNDDDYYDDDDIWDETNGLFPK